MKKIASSALVGICACWSQLACAQTEPQVALDVSIGGGVSTNPFLYVDGETAGSATISVAPSIIVEDELGRSQIGGNAYLSQYSKRYGSAFGGRIDASSERMLDERTTARIYAGLQTSRSAVQDGLTFGGAPIPDSGVILPPDVPIVDTTIAGTRSRITSVNTGFTVSRTLDEVSSIDGGVALSSTHIGNDVGYDYRDASAQLGYRRTLSARTTLTLGAQAGVVDYVGRRIGDSVILSPRVGVQQQLSSRLSLVADAGISYVRTALGGGVHSSTISFAGSLGLCDRSPGGSLCIAASRSAQPTALGGVSTVSTVSVNYETQLSDVDRIALSGRYGRTNQDGNGFGLTRVTDLVGATATYSRKLSDRVFFTVSPTYSKIYDDLQHRDANFGLTVGLTIRLGKQR